MCREERAGAQEGAGRGGGKAVAGPTNARRGRPNQPRFKAQLAHSLRRFRGHPCLSRAALRWDSTKDQQPDKPPRGSILIIPLPSPQGSRRRRGFEACAAICTTPGLPTDEKTETKGEGSDEKAGRGQWQGWNPRPRRLLSTRLPPHRSLQAKSQAKSPAGLHARPAEPSRTSALRCGRLGEDGLPLTPASCAGPAGWGPVTGTSQPPRLQEQHTAPSVAVLLCCRSGCQGSAGSPGLVPSTPACARPSALPVSSYGHHTRDKAHPATPAHSSGQAHVPPSTGRGPASIH